MASMPLLLLLWASLSHAEDGVKSAAFMPHFTVGGEQLHEQQSFHFSTFERTFRVHAVLNTELFAKEYAETVSGEDGDVHRRPSEGAANAPARACHYRATIEGDAHGLAAFSTCSGGIDGRFIAFGLDLAVRPESPVDDTGRRRRLDEQRHVATHLADEQS